MKIDANIRWKTDCPPCGIKSGDTSAVLVDADYVAADMGEVEEWVENAVSETFGRSFVCGDDFEITNPAEVIGELE